MPSRQSSEMSSLTFAPILSSSFGRRLQNKMKEYMTNGAQLGWLIDPIRHQVHVFHADSSVEILDHPPVISGEPLLPGFVLRLEGIID